MGVRGACYRNARTELPDAGQPDGEAMQEGDAPLVTALLGAKGGDMVDLNEGDVPNSASRLQRKPFRQQTHQLRKLLLRHQGGDAGLLQSERCGLERAPVCQTESLYEYAAPGKPHWEKGGEPRWQRHLPYSWYSAPLFAPYRHCSTSC